MQMQKKNASEIQNLWENEHSFKKSKRTKGSQKIKPQETPGKSQKMGGCIIFLCVRTTQNVRNKHETINLPGRPLSGAGPRRVWGGPDTRRRLSGRPPSSPAGGQRGRRCWPSGRRPGPPRRAGGAGTSGGPGGPRGPGPGRRHPTVCWAGALGCGGIRPDPKHLEQSRVEGPGQCGQGGGANPKPGKSGPVAGGVFTAPFSQAVASWGQLGRAVQRQSNLR